MLCIQLYHRGWDMLHCLGTDHERLTFRSQGRDYRLTDVEGRVARELLA